MQRNTSGHAKNTNEHVKKYKLQKRDKSEQTEKQLNVKKYLFKCTLLFVRNNLWDDRIQFWAGCTYKLI